MDSDDKFKTCTIGIIAATLCFLVISVVFYYSYENYVMTKNGYTQGAIPGSAYTKWVLPNK